MERNKSIDFTAGVMLSFVIISHITNISGSQTLFYALMQLVFFYRMPWFFFKAGMFCKERDFKSEVEYSAKKILIPFVIYSAIALFVDLLTSAICYGYESVMSLETIVLHPIKTLIKAGFIEPNTPLWFMTSLFCVRVLFSLTKKYKINLYLVGALGLAIAFALHFKMYFTPRYIPNVCLGLFFFITGYLLKEIQFSKKWLLWLCLAIYAITVIFFYSWVDFTTNNLKQGYYLVYVVASLCGCIVFNNFATLPFVKYTKIFPSIGRNSMNYYVTHYFLLVGLNKFISMYYEPRICFYILIAVAIVTLPLVNWLINKCKAARLK